VVKFAHPVTVLVTDMSGFTRLTRTYGIVHFASLIVRMRQIAYGIIARYPPLTAALLSIGTALNSILSADTIPSWSTQKLIIYCVHSVSQR
jgi:hypothetical protein